VASEWVGDQLGIPSTSANWPGQILLRSCSLKSEALDHTKTKRLCRHLRIPLYQAVGILETLWHITAKQAIRGDIGKLSDEDIALGLDYRDDEAKLIQALIHCGWIETHPEHRLIIHDWPDHAPDTVHRKMARARLVFVNGDFPNTNRLAGSERTQADQFYGVVRPNQQNGRTEGQNGRTPGANPTLPHPTPPYPTVLPARGGVESGEFPKTAGAVRDYFPATDNSLITVITQSAFREYADVVNDNPKIPPLTDEVIAHAVREAHFPSQRSAGLFREKVPRVIRTWAEEAVRKSSTH